MDLSENPIYEPLFYCWGDATIRETISCIDVSISITISLYDALLHLRYPDRIRTLWVDALCINQTSIPERQQQLSLMRRIYSRGQGTLAWIGAEDEDSKLGLALMLDMVGCFHLCRLPRNQKIPMCYMYSEFRQGFKADAPEDQLNAILKTLGRAYFSRTWIGQGLVVAPSSSIFCGDVEMWRCLGQSSS